MFVNRNVLVDILYGFKVLLAGEKRRSFIKRPFKSSSAGNLIGHPHRSSSGDTAAVLLWSEESETRGRMVLNGIELFNK